jgi:hypothetical protein
MSSSNTSATSLSNSGKSDVSTDGNSDIFNQQPTVIEIIEEWRCHHGNHLLFRLKRSLFTTVFNVRYSLF